MKESNSLITAIKASRAKIIVFIFFIIGGISLSNIPKLTDATKYFPKNTLIRENILTLTQKSVGMPLLDIILKIDQKEISISQLEKIERIETTLKNTLKTYNAHLLSANELARRINKEYSGNEKIPSSLMAYFALLSKAPESLTNTFHIDNHYKITVLGPLLEQQVYQQLINKLSMNISNENYSWRFSGIHYFLTNAQKEMIYTLLKSFLLSLTVISILSSFWLKSIRYFGIFLFINHCPIMISFRLISSIKISPF